MKNGINAQIDQAAHYLHGRFEAQIESFAKALGCDASELTTRVGVLLIGIDSEQQLVVSPMRHLRLGSTGLRDELREMEGDSSSFKSGPRSKSSVKRNTRQASNRKVKRQSPLTGKRQDWWWKLPQSKRNAIIAKRKRNRLVNQEANTLKA